MIYTGLAKTPLQVARHLVKNEGVLGLYDGLSAAVMRQASYTTLRIGLYDIISDRMSQSCEQLSFGQRAIAGLAAGGLASFISNPIEVCLVRMQADGRSPIDQRRNYRHVFDALVRIAREEGLLTYWRGASPTVARAMIVSMTQLGVYDQAKDIYQSLGWFKSGTPLHLAGALTSGIVYSFCSLPLDTVKTRMQDQKRTQDGRMQYTSTLQTLRHIALKEGITSLWKGYLPYFARAGGHTVAMFLFLEQYRRLAQRFL